MQTERHSYCQRKSQSSITTTITNHLAVQLSGLYLTPISRDADFASGILTGEYKDWAALMLGGPQAVSNFPLKVPLSLAESQCLYFSDRVRWSQAAEKQPDAQKAK